MERYASRALRTLAGVLLVLALAGAVAGGLLIPALPWEADRSDPAQKVDLPGLPNLYRVSDQLYRGAQPRTEGVAGLKALGIRTVVDLRNSDADRRLLEGSGIRLVRLPMIAFFPSRAKYRRFLRLFDDPANLPVFVHCRHGSDRTGAAVALYRVHLQGWAVEEAIAEMTGGGFGFHRIHGHLKGFVRSFSRQD